jgi:hypothetical protein
VIKGRASGESSVHYRFHSRLLVPFQPGGARLDGIVVPAARSAEHLEPALQLGAALGVPVVLMCSHNVRPRAVAAVAGEVPGAEWRAVDIHPGLRSRLPELHTSGFMAAVVGTRGDLSLKRNLGLLIGRAAGWRTLLFLDDDIVDLRPHAIAHAVGGLDQHSVVGMPARYYPDNSVVCHARRFIPGSRQGVFVGGNALAISVDRCDSFFPEIYNEDWLFLAPHLDKRKVAADGNVQQLPYDPFEIPDRATSEEFGDVLAEGLVGHLHRGSLNRPPTAENWSAFLDRRARFIAEALAACADRAADDNEARKALSALRRAENAREKILPAILTKYLAAWLDDLRLWRDYLAGVPRLGTLEAALDWLDRPVALSPSPRKDAE